MRSERRRHTPAVRLALATTLALSLHAPVAKAAPAPWYVWLSKLDSRPFCSQTEPGPGWERSRGPYRDSQCRTPYEVRPRAPLSRPSPHVDTGQPSPISSGTPRTAD